MRKSSNYKFINLDIIKQLVLRIYKFFGVNIDNIAVHEVIRNICAAFLFGGKVFHREVFNATVP